MREKKKKEYSSLAWQVVFFPIGIVIVICIISVMLSVVGIMNLWKQQADSITSIMSVSANQLESELDQISSAAATYISSSSSFRYLSKLENTNEIGKYLGYRYDTINWMTEQGRRHKCIDGIMVYYENIDLLIYHSNVMNFSMHKYAFSQIGTDRTYDRWEITEVEDVYYLFCIKKYGTFYYAVWMPVDSVMKQLNIQSFLLSADVYFFDYRNVNTIKEEKLNKGLYQSECGKDKEWIKLSGKYYYRMTGKMNNGELGLGVLVTAKSIRNFVPKSFQWIIVLVVFSIIFIPVLLKWLRIKVAKPMGVLDEAMKRVANGEMDYRITIESHDFQNELERLSSGFNEMLDEINSLEVNLYKTQLREQKIKYKYISQMIRPHFVLNALNIVCSYRDTEFAQAKKLVGYLMEYFRYIVYLKTDYVELKQEMHYIETYLKIQKERYLDAFDFFVEWEAEVSGIMIPPLILQTFVENCIKYGKRDDEINFVYVLAGIENDKLKLMIADSGYGFSKESLDAINRFIETREYNDELGVGIQNAIERMDISYGERVEVKAGNVLSGGAIFTIYLPMNI